MNRLHALLACALLLSIPSVASAQRIRGAPVQGEDTASIPAAVEGELATWRGRHGESWRIVRDHETGWARFLFGGARAWDVEPVSDQDFADLARVAIAETVGMHGLEVGTLVLDRVTFLPLGLAGSNDKVTVRLQQVLGGVPVIGGSVHVLFDLQGRLLSLDSLGLPALSNLQARAAYGPRQAELTARAFFELDTGAPATSATTPELRVARVVADKLAEPRLVWEVTLHFSAPGFQAEGFTYRLDALNGGLVERLDAIHNDVSGNVKSLATPGTKPDSGSNPAGAQDMPYLTVTSSQGDAVTDADGNFTIVGASAPLNVTVSYDGTYADTVNQAGSDYSLTQNLTLAAGNTIVMNPGPNDNVTAEANAFLWIGKMRDWTRAVNASDATSDFKAPANVNINDNCNAFYNGSSVNFFLPGGGCVNSAYSSVVLHEMGHWLNDRYASYNGADGFGEGNADVFAMYFLDHPLVGEDFGGPGSHIRDGANTRTFCGDCCSGCYGAVHADGEVLMGALWKLRTRLQTTYGSVSGGAAADILFNAWMNAYDDQKIKTIIEDHWLTLDDDNGNLYDGTPNHADIDGGFRDQGFPGVDLRNLTITGVTQLADTLDEVGPHAVSADVVANFAAPVSSVDLKYRVNGGAIASVAMTLGSGTTYSASIPGQLSPARVEYFIEATDSLAATTTEPTGAPGSTYDFAVGTLATHYFEDFESGANGWTHVSNNGAQDDWMLSSEEGLNGAAGTSGDPDDAYSGTNIWGNDLGPTGFNGAYSNDVDNSLLSPLLDFSSVKGARLRFKRWLTVEWGLYDYARVLVNGTEVWINEISEGDVIDSSWQCVEYDISHLADGNASVQLEWNLRSDGGLTYGGWNIDDVEVLSVIGTPMAQFSGTPVSGLAPLTVDFSDASTGGASAWSWTFGDGGVSSLQDPSHTYAGTGTYDVSLTVTGPGGSDTETKLAYVVVENLPAPVAGFVSDRRFVRKGEAVAFTDASSGMVSSWSWTFGDGETSTDQDPTHLYRKSGLYTVSLTITGPGGSDTHTKVDLVLVLGGPAVRFTNLPLTPVSF